MTKSKYTPPPGNKTTSVACCIVGNTPSLHLRFRISSRETIGFSYQHLDNHFLLDDYHEENGKAEPCQRLILEFTQGVVTLTGVRLGKLLNPLSQRLLFQVSPLKHKISLLISSEAIITSIEALFYDKKTGVLGPSRHQPKAPPPEKLGLEDDSDGLPDD